ncbi:hypothetical protein G9C98_001520 [Cotesia typhae]|uniref:PID domain-containing protein n=1 Tax=Cotesia typhae TaxID=2053667 RepID=A0A8J5R0B5_9HYME|nr:hypothetical protein G9C98_001520 [Cotesia typhae]
MRNSTLLKWAQTTNNKNQSSKNGGTNRNWIHPPDALQKGHIAYLVKYLGSTEVDQPKGIEVVKEAICKLKFNQQLRKSEGTKTPKVELTISIDGVAIQEPKTKTTPKMIKARKKFFSFIAKEKDAERHTCFVFVSDKLAEEITLTIGQAFGLAYRRFLETSGKDLETQRRCMADVQSYLAHHNLPDILHVPSNSDAAPEGPRLNGTSHVKAKNDANGNDSRSPPPVPPRNFDKAFDDDFITNNESSSSIQSPAVGTKLEGLLMDEFEEDFNPRAYETTANGFGNHQNNNLSNGQSASLFVSSNGNGTTPPLLAPPPKVKDSRRHNGVKEDLFGSVPFNPPLPLSSTSNDFNNDPFEMGEFAAFSVSNPSQQELENAIGLLDKRLLEMKDGFSRGLSMGTDDFSLESLDPLRN